MFLVVGQRGSEARLVADALDAHPDLTVAGGGELLLPLAFLFQRVSDPDRARALAADLIVADRDFADGIGRHLDADAVHRALAAAPPRLGPALEAVYTELAVAAGARQAGTLLTVLGNPVLNRAGLYDGDIRLLHVVRDVRSVVAESHGHQTPRDIARVWDQGNRTFRDRRGGDPATYALVRYEDFAGDPGRAVAELAGMLGIAGDRRDLPTVVDAPPPLAPEVRAEVTAVAEEGLYDFGYDPPLGSPRRALRLVARRAGGAWRRVRRGTTAARARLWALRVPVPWAPAGEAETLAKAACNVCRWTGATFAGHEHAESADCPRCGSIARERFHLHGLGLDAGSGRLRLLETAPRLSGSYARAMRRWFDYEVLDPAPRGGPLGHLAGLADLPADGVDRLLSAHDLQSVPDPDAVLAEIARVLAPGGLALVQVPVLDAVTTALPAAETAAAGTARWSFGADLAERLSATGLAVDVLVTDELADLVAAGPGGWAKAPSSGEVDLAGVLTGLSGHRLTPVADQPTARRRGWTPAVLFCTFRARKAA